MLRLQELAISEIQFLKFSEAEFPRLPVPDEQGPLFYPPLFDS